MVRAGLEWLDYLRKPSPIINTIPMNRQLIQSVAEKAAVELGYTPTPYQLRHQALRTHHLPLMAIHPPRLVGIEGEKRREELYAPAQHTHPSVRTRVAGSVPGRRVPGHKHRTWQRPQTQALTTWERRPPAAQSLKPAAPPSGSRGSTGVSAWGRRSLVFPTRNPWSTEDGAGIPVDTRVRNGQLARPWSGSPPLASVPCAESSLRSGTASAHR